ncbi:MAG: aminotransferase class I/II-fold pyridoxal phosphate-dependent enzyme [Desulfobacterales bacterium]
MNPLAQELNAALERGNAHILTQLSAVGRQLFFPKGILSQSAEAKEQAHRINATIGIAKEAGHTMHLGALMAPIEGLRPAETLTYAPSFGIPALREAWRKSIYRKNPSIKELPLSLPVVTCGITHGVSLVADMWLDPGDTVVLPEKMWGNYNLIMGIRRGVELRTFETFTPAGGYNLQGLETTLKTVAAEKSKVTVLFNFPHNPTGYTVSEVEAEAIVAMLTGLADQGTEVLALCDDAYFGLVYEAGVLEESLFARLCGRHPRLLPIKLDGATKEDDAGGLRVGFVTYCPWVEGDAEAVLDALARKTAGAVRGTISNASHLSQTLLLQALQHPRYPEQKVAKFEILKRRALKVKAVAGDDKYAALWGLYPFNSGYFMCLRLKTVGAEPLRRHLLRRHGVGLIALGQSDLRVAFSCLEEDDVETLFDLIRQGIEELTRDG